MDHLPTEVLARVAEYLPCGDGWGAFRLACRACRTASAEAAKLLRLHDHTRAAALAAVFKRARLYVGFMTPERLFDDEFEGPVARPVLTFPDGLRRLLGAGRVAKISADGYDLSAIDAEDLARVEKLSLSDCARVGHLLGHALKLKLMGCHDDRPATTYFGRARSLVLEGGRLTLNLSTLGEAGPPTRPAPTFRHLERVSVHKHGDDLSDPRGVDCHVLDGRPGLQSVAPFARARSLGISCNNCISDASPLCGVRELYLGSSSVADASMLWGAEVLSLAGTSVADVSALGGVRVLRLSHCRNVLDVSALGGVRELHLGHTAVTNVSMLGGVRELHLGFTAVVDVSMLGGVELLDLYGCSRVRDASALGGVRTLILSGTSVSSLEGLNAVRDLSVLGCPHLLDLSGLEGFTGTVQASIFPETRGLHALRRAKKATLQLELSGEGGPPPAFDLGPLEGVREIEVGSGRNSRKIVGLRAFSCAESVRLERVALPDGATDLGFLARADNVFVNDVRGLASLRGAEAAREVSAFNCSDLVDVRVSPTTERVKLSRCPRVADLSPLDGLDSLYLSGASIVYVGGLKRVRNLAFGYCPNLANVGALAAAESICFRGCRPGVVAQARALGGPLAADGMADPARPFAGPVVKTVR